jgi:Tol biopolymer transport system component
LREPCSSSFMIANGRKVLASLPGDHMHSDWSPDGRRLTFRGDIGDFPQIYLTNPVRDPLGEQTRQLTN